MDQHERTSHSGRLGNDIKEKIRDLANELATNYCTVSFGEAEKENVKLKDIFSDDAYIYNHIKDKDTSINQIQQHRNILVIGAGATYDAYKCIPLGQQVIEGFKEKYLGKIDDFPAIKQKHDSYIEELRLQNGVLDFENYLALLAELILTPEELRKEISELYNFQHPPSLFYEIISHLFKHSFIDVIINFNFDEILDRVIEDELGKENYFHILTDGDCVSIDEIMVDGRLKTPIYIKPHGTVSHKSTLRFTKRQYLDVPDQIKALLTNLISGKRGKVVASEMAEDITKVNIISVGYNMASLEFNNILNDFLPADSNIYHFMYNNSDPRDPHYVHKILPAFYKRAFEKWQQKLDPTIPAEESLNEFNRSIYKRIAIESFEKSQVHNDLTTPFGEIFSTIWRAVISQFKGNLKPRSISRHEIISYLFTNTDFANEAALTRDDLKERYENSVDYFLDRTIVEIAMAINRKDGIVEIAQLLNDRTGYYYTQYRKAYYKKNNTFQDVKSIYDIINQFADRRSGNELDINYSRNIFRIDLKILERLKNNQILKDEFNTKTIAPNSIKGTMKRYMIVDFSISEKNEPKIDSQMALVKLMRGKFFDMIFENPDKYNPITVALLHFLFTSPLLSNSFINNLKKNYKKIVYNGRKYDISGYKDDEFKSREHWNEDSPWGIKMFDELIRLFNKSVGSHFYTIRPKYNDPKNFLTESFSKQKIPHTNLAIEYMFRSMFLNQDWDVALIIAESGGLLEFLNGEEVVKSFKNKKIIMINSHEAIRQLYPNDKMDPIQLNEKRNNEYIRYLKKVDQWLEANTIFTFSMPAIQHNHHTMIFLKKTTTINDSKKNYPLYKISTSDSDAFSMVGALYMYRMGFSNSINPIFIGRHPYDKSDILKSLNYDFKKLLRIFSTNFWRAMVFGNITNIEGLNIDFSNYLNWDLHEEQANLEKLVRFLYNFETINSTTKYNPELLGGLTRPVN